MCGFTKTALHLVSLDRPCCNASAGLMEVKIHKLNLSGVTEQGLVSGDSCIQRGFLKRMHDITFRAYCACCALTLTRCLSTTLNGFPTAAYLRNMSRRIVHSRFRFWRYGTRQRSAVATRVMDSGCSRPQSLGAPGSIEHGNGVRSYDRGYSLMKNGGASSYLMTRSLDSMTRPPEGGTPTFSNQPDMPKRI